MSKKNEYNWSMVFFLSVIPLIGVVGTSIYIYLNGVVWQEPFLFFLFWFLSGMGITMGYHRLFAHKSFKTNTFVEWILMLLGSMAFENTILKWSSDHRVHHSKPETDEDPYSIKEGFWHAHIGWILKKTPEEKSRIKGVADLQKKSAVRFQSKYYFYIGIILGFVFPLAIGFLYGRPIGALLWAGFLRVTVVHHATFFINSLCHYVGKRPYDSKSSARDSWLVSFFTFGEGYHNYHHTFQWDYRNGIKWFAFDPSKWIIKILSFFGVTYDLKVAPDYMIWKNHLESLKDQLNKHINLSTEKCKNFYNQKINNLYREIDFTISDWTKMELEISKLNNKISIDSIRSKRNKYVLKLKEIKKDLKQITFNIKRNYFISEFAS